MSKILQHILHITTTFILTILIAVSCALISSCGTTKYVYLPGETIYNYKDSVIVHVDSVKVDVPIERYVDIVNYTDTLTLETSVAKAIAYADTISHTLKGDIKNKTTQLKKEIIYKDRIIEKEVYKDKPYPVEVDKEVKIHPWYERILWVMSAIGLIFMVLLTLKIYRKIVLHV